MCDLSYSYSPEAQGDQNVWEDVGLGAIQFKPCV